MQVWVYMPNDYETEPSSVASSPEAAVAQMNEAHAGTWYSLVTKLYSIRGNESYIDVEARDGKTTWIDGTLMPFEVVE